MFSFTKISNTTRRIAAVVLASAGLAAATPAQADATDACFNYLKENDVENALQEGQQLIARGNLSRKEQLYSWLCLGTAYKGSGRIQDALTAWQKVENMAQTTEELEISYAALGAIYDDLHDLDRAELYYQRSLSSNRKLGNKSGAATALKNLGDIAKNRGDIKRALALYQQSLESEQDAAKKSVTLNNIAIIYSSRKEYDLATKSLRQALEINQRNGNAHKAAQYQLNLGFILTNSKKYGDAEEQLTAGLNTIRLIGDKDWEATAYHYFGDLALASKSKANGLSWSEWYKKSEALYREIGDTKNAEELANILAGK